jgi:ArsR family transcriptional regulator
MKRGSLHRRTPIQRTRRPPIAVTEIPLTASPASCCVPIAQASMSEEDAEATAAVMKSLGDAARVRIVNLLANAGEPVCVCDLTPSLGLAQATVSYHLKKLMSVGLLRREQRGTWAYYSVDGDALARLATVIDAKGGRG